MADNKMSKNKFYIPNLNGLRFFAAFGVIIGHIELTKKGFGLPNLIESGTPFFSTGGGHLGVLLFFVLSGFLITLLILKERDVKSEINYKKFLMRRILRIWPLYFLFITFVIFIYHGYSWIEETVAYPDLTIFLYYLILPNVAISGIATIQYIPHLWSIGVEEQFYIIWPLFFKKLKDKYIILILISITFIIPIIPHVCDFLSIRFEQWHVELRFIRLFFSYFLINAMAIGALMAYLYLYKKEFVKKVLTKNINILITIFVFVFWVFHPSLGYFKDVLFSLFFSIMILSLSINGKLFLLENKVVNYLGNISYGLYVYHWLIIGYTSSFISNNYKLYFSTIIITIIVSSLSYEFIEKPILKFKSRYSIVKT